LTSSRTVGKRTARWAICSPREFSNLNKSRTFGCGMSLH